MRVNPFNPADTLQKSAALYKASAIKIRPYVEGISLVIFSAIGFNRIISWAYHFTTTHLAHTDAKFSLLISCTQNVVPLGRPTRATYIEVTYF